MTTGSMDSLRELSDRGEGMKANKNQILVKEEVCVDSREVRDEDDDRREREWRGGHVRRRLSQDVGPKIVEEREGDAITVMDVDERFGVRGEDMV